MPLGGGHIGFNYYELLGETPVHDKDNFGIRDFIRTICMESYMMIKELKINLCIKNTASCLGSNFIYSYCSLTT